MAAEHGKIDDTEKAALLKKIDEILLKKEDECQRLLEASMCSLPGSQRLRKEIVNKGKICSSLCELHF